MTSTRPYVLGAHVAGWSAFAIDVMLDRYAAPYLAAMSPDQRAEMLATRAAVHAAALLWQERGGSGSGTGSGPLGADEAGSEMPLQVMVADAALALGSSGRRVRKLAERWEAQGLARKVGREWLIDREAIEMHIAKRGRVA